MRLFGKPRDERRAVAYYRHSAEDKQENSIPIQRKLTQEYARHRGIIIIHEEADEGKSGLNADRPGFTRLFKEWIFNTSAPSFKYVLVYDVSRWGRFQDQDEAGYYTFLCRKYGKQVRWVAYGDRFDDGDLIAQLWTSIERSMAAAYSRNLSEKVFHGCAEVSRQGFSAGGTACYGLERLLLDVSRQPVRTLKYGEHKAIANERVTFRPRNDASTQVVQEIFRLCVQEWKTPSDIAACLNERSIPSPGRRLWTASSVARVLANRAYVGTRVYNKTWGRLKQKRRVNPPRAWVVTPKAFPPTVEEQMFETAQRHLYWIHPSSWKGGVYAIQRTRRMVDAEVVQSLERDGVSRDIARRLLPFFPMTLSIAQNDGDRGVRWCFILPEAVWRYSSVLAIGVFQAHNDSEDRAFLLSTTRFAPTGVLAFAEQDALATDGAIPEADIRRVIARLAKETLEQSFEERVPLGVESTNR